MPECRLDQLTAADLPRLFGRYELQCILGAGGMGSVLGAELHGPAGFRKPVAIKVLQPEVVGQLSVSKVAAFIREARLGGLLKHPNIVEVYELAEVDDQLFISMEWVRGLTLHQIIQRGCRPPVGGVLDIAAGMAAGLASAHGLSADGREAGLVHRDLKPSNVLVSWSGEVKLADFGIATTQHGELAASGQAFSHGRGTPSYMSPEQMLGEPVDGRSDLFALGLVLTELVTARSLPRNQLLQHLQSGGDRSVRVVPERRLTEVDEVVPGLRRILERCLAPRVADRYPSAGALLHDLRVLRAAHPSPVSLSRWLRRTFPQGTDLQDAPPTATITDSCTSQWAGGVEPRAQTPIEAPHTPKRTNLGEPLDRYVGRAEELEALGARYEAGARLVTIRGTGGAGKTRFAQRYARGQIARLDGGSWLVDLTEARTARDIVQATAQALEVPLGRGDLGALCRQVGLAIKGRGPVLLIFDNFEQIVQHAPQTLARWTTSAPEARFLVTSRESLRIPGEQIYALEPLPDAQSVELFELRAAATGARWPSTTANRRAILEIVQQLDGIPLAIELAAAMAPLLPPQQLRERLSQRFTLLRRGRRGASTRQASLQGLIDWSWELLEPWEQAALAQLSVFRDGFDMPAAEAVLDLSDWPDAPWSLDIVGALLDKSLLNSHVVFGQPRFSMYVSIQAYAATRLADATQPTALRHAAYFATRDPGRQPYPGDIFNPQTSFMLEIGNLLAGVAASLEAGDAEQAARCGLSAARLFLTVGPYTSGSELLEDILPHTKDTPLHCALLYQLSLLHYYSGNPDVARGILAEAIALAQATGEVLLEASSLSILANIYRLEGSPAEGRSHYERALVLYREAGDIRGEATVLSRLGLLYNGQGHIKAAMKSIRQALRLFQQSENRSAEGTSLGHLGILLYEQGRYAEALSYYARALQIHRDSGNRAAEAATLGDMALVHQDRGEYAQAVTHSKVCLTISRELGNPTMVGLMLGNLAAVYSLQGQLSWAQSLFEEALAIAREVSNHRNEVLALGNLGDVLWLRGDLEGAEKSLRECIAVNAEVAPVASGVFRGSLALICAVTGRVEAAQDLMARAEPQIRGFHTFELGKFLCKKVQVELLAGRAEEARAALAEAESIAAELKVRPGSELHQKVGAARAKLTAALDPAGAESSSARACSE